MTRSGRLPRVDRPWNHAMMKADGLTVFASDAHGKRRVIARHDMPMREALREIAWQLDSWEGDWRIDCISTPTTIHRDLNGSRAHRTRAGGSSEAEVEYPEKSYLSSIGRMDLWRRP